MARANWSLGIAVLVLCCWQHAAAGRRLAQTAGGDGPAPTVEKDGSVLVLTLDLASDAVLNTDTTGGARRRLQAVTATATDCGTSGLSGACTLPPVSNTMLVNSSLGTTCYNKVNAPDGLSVPLSATTLTQAELPANAALKITLHGLDSSNYTVDSNGNLVGDLNTTYTGNNNKYVLQTFVIPKSFIVLPITTIKVTFTDTSGPNPPPNKCVYVDWVALDVSGPDVTPPVITPPAGLLVTKDLQPQANTAKVTYSVSATDPPSGAPVTPTCTPASGSDFPAGDTTVTCQATDAAGNVGTATFTVRVNDVTAPNLVVTVPASPIEATGASTVVTWTVKATDAVTAAPVISCSHNSGDGFGLGTTTVQCNATDAAGNKATKSFSFTIVDTTAPAITPVADISKEATGPTTEVTWTISASDLVDGVVPVTCTPVSGTAFAVGSTTVNCEASDTAGNKATSSFTVTIVDTTPPTITPVADISKEATGPTTEVTWTISASDLVDGVVPVTCTPVSGTAFAVGSTTVECEASDTAGNKATSSFKVTIVDTTPPTITPVADISKEATGPTTEVTWTISASDLVDGVVPVTCTPVSGTAFAVGSTTVECEASDAAGNKATSSFKVTITDTTPPVVTVPASFIVDVTAANAVKDANGIITGATATWEATASDLVDGSVPVTCTPASGSAFAVGTTTTVVCSATDAHGNTGTAQFTVTCQQCVFDGFRQPLENEKIQVVTPTQTVPLKWGMQGNYGLAILQAGSPSIAPVACTSVSAEAEDVPVTELNSVLKYDSLADQYNYGLHLSGKIPATPGKCYRVTVALKTCPTKKRTITIETK